MKWRYPSLSPQTFEQLRYPKPKCIDWFLYPTESSKQLYQFYQIFTVEKYIEVKYTLSDRCFNVCKRMYNKNKTKTTLINNADIWRTHLKDFTNVVGSCTNRIDISFTEHFHQTITICLKNPFLQIYKRIHVMLYKYIRKYYNVVAWWKIAWDFLLSYL